jgi:hypothetical protein
MVWFGGMKNFLSASVLAVFLGAGLVQPVAAQTRVYTENQNRLNASWTVRGGASVNGSTVTLTERAGEDEYAYQDVAVPHGGGKWAVLVAYGKAETVRSRDITGLPYIYGYAMNDQGKILSYLQRPSMTFKGRAGAWDVLSANVKLPLGTTKVRYFLQQAEKKDSPKYGDDAIFYKPAFYVVDTFEAGRDLINNYRFGLDLL